MAEKSQGKEKGGSIERVYTIPLRSEWLKKPRAKRGKKSINTIRLFLSKHTHTNDIKISQRLNERIWERGIKKPPAKVKVMVKESDGIVTAYLPEEALSIKKEETKKKEPEEEKPAKEKPKEEGEGKPVEKKESPTEVKEGIKPSEEKKEEKPKGE